MSKATELKDGHESVNNGSPEKRIGDTDVGDNEGEDSDDYEIDDEVEGDEEDEEDEGENVEKGENKLTHLLLGNTNGIGADEAEDQEDEDEGDDDDDDDDDYVEGEEDPPKPLNKKRSIDEVAEEEASQGSKKVKA